MSVVVSCLMPGAESDRAAEGLWGAASRCAESTGARHVAILFAKADSAIAAAAAVVADQVVVCDDDRFSQYQSEACLKALELACRRLEPTIVLLGQDTYSQELAPRLAHRLGGCSLGDAQALCCSDGGLEVTRGAYGGKADAVFRLSAMPSVVWIRSRAFEPASSAGEPATIEPAELGDELDDSLFTTGPQLVERLEESDGSVRLEEAALIVSGGRGLGGPEPFEHLHALAGAIGGQVAASRAACDAGWVPPGLQVGQTGKKVSPALYLAIGISGASQHLMGISDAKVVAAINTDPDAPIFRRCQFGLVEDWKQVVGPLTTALQNRRESGDGRRE